jgi:hypothetical protein
MENKQTAIEWLEDNLNFEPYDEKEFISNNKIWDKAKQMEKEQIINAYWASYKEGQYSGDKTAEEYYQETYEQ